MRSPIPGQRGPHTYCAFPPPPSPNNGMKKISNGSARPSRAVRRMATLRGAEEETEEENVVVAAPFALSAVDHEHLMTRDADFACHTWEDLKGIIGKFFTSPPYLYTLCGNACPGGQVRGLGLGLGLGLGANWSFKVLQRRTISRRCDAGLRIWRGISSGASRSKPSMGTS